MIERDTLLKIESNLKVIKTLVKLMIEKGTSPDSIEHLRSLMSRNLELIGGDVCDLCSDPTKSTKICWPCWHLETVLPGDPLGEENIEMKRIPANAPIRENVPLASKCKTCMLLICRKCKKLDRETEKQHGYIVTIKCPNYRKEILKEALDES